MRIARTVTGIAFCLTMFAGHATAQEFNQVQVIIDPRLDIEWARSIRKQVRRTAEERVENPFSVDPGRFGADLAPETTKEPAREPPQSSLDWNFWFEGGGGFLEITEFERGYEGHQQTYSLGLDATVTERLMLGAIANLNGTDIDNSFLPGNSTTHGWAAGGYAAYFLTSTVILTGSVLYTATDNESESLGVTADYDSQGWNANAELISYHFVDAWTLKPAMGLSYSHETDEAYLDSGSTAYPETVTKTGTFSVGGTAVYTIATGNRISFEPYVGVEAEWVFLNRTEPAGGFAEDDRDFDVIVSAGADFTISNALSFSVDAAFAGLAQSEYQSVTGSGHLTLSF